MTGFARSVTSLQVHASATARLRRHVRILRQDRCLRGIHAFYAHLVAALQGSTCWRSKAIAQTGGPQCDCCRSTTTLGAAAPGQWPGLAVRAVHRHRASASRPVSPRRCSSASAGVSAGSWRRHAATSHVRALPSTSALCASPRPASLRATVESPVGQLRLCRIALPASVGRSWRSVARMPCADRGDRPARRIFLFRTRARQRGYAAAAATHAAASHVQDTKKPGHATRGRV